MKTELAKALSDVDGWLDLEMAWVLHEAARCFPSPARHISVIEIGSWKGRSTIALALGLKARGGGKVYAIDPHTGSEQTVWERGQMDTYDEFIENIKAPRVIEFVEPIRTTSHMARDRFHDSSAHLLVVDASHEDREFVEIVDDWTTALVEGAVIVIRDPFDVYRALRRRALRLYSPFRRPTLVNYGDSLLLEFQRRKPWVYQDGVALLVFVVLHLIHALRRAKAFRKHMPDWVKSLFEEVDGPLCRAMSGIRQHQYLDYLDRVGRTEFSMYARDFYMQSEITRASTLMCSYCGHSDEYQLKWLVRQKRDQLPGGADEQDRAKFQWLQSYMVLADYGVTCQNPRCLKYFPVSGIKTMAFL